MNFKIGELFLVLFLVIIKVADILSTIRIATLVRS